MRQSHMLKQRLHVYCFSMEQLLQSECCQTIATGSKLHAEVEAMGTASAWSNCWSQSAAIWCRHSQNRLHKLWVLICEVVSRHDSKVLGWDVV